MNPYIHKAPASRPQTRPLTAHRSSEAKAADRTSQRATESTETDRYASDHDRTSDTC